MPCQDTENLSILSDNPIINVQMDKLDSGIRYYKATLQIDNHESTWLLRFSQLLKGESLLPENIINAHPLPPKHIFFNYSTNEKNCKQRAMEIQDYLSKLFTNDEIIQSNIYHESIGLIDYKLETILSKFIEEQNNIKQEILSKKQSRYQKQFDLSQSFFHNAKHEQMPILLNSDDIKFSFPRDGWKSGNSPIEGPDGRTWFNIEHLNGKWVITTMTKEKETLMTINRDRDIISLFRNTPSGSEKWCTFNSPESGCNLSCNTKSRLCPAFEVCKNKGKYLIYIGNKQAASLYINTRKEIEFEIAKECDILFILVVGVLVDYYLW